MEAAEAMWLWIGAAGMAAGTALFMVLARGEREEHVHHYVTHWMITLVAAAAYLAMAMGQGRIETANAGRAFFYARYVDWAITTPLLLLGLVALALPHHEWDKTELTLGLLGTDVFMIVTGLFAALSSDAGAKWTWYFVSTGSFLAVLYILSVPLRRHAAALLADERHLFTRAEALLTALWFGYPLIWIVGTQGLAVVSSTGGRAVHRPRSAGEGGLWLRALRGVHALVPRPTARERLPVGRASPCRGTIAEEACPTVLPPLPPRRCTPRYRAGGVGWATPAVQNTLASHVAPGSRCRGQRAIRLVP